MEDAHRLPRVVSTGPGRPYHWDRVMVARAASARPSPTRYASREERARAVDRALGGSAPPLAWSQGARRVHQRHMGAPTRLTRHERRGVGAGVPYAYRPAHHAEFSPHPHL